MKPLLLVLLLSGTLAAANAQVIVQPLLPPSGTIMKSQLWNAVISNTSNQTPTVQLTVSVTRAQNNLPVFTGISRPFVLRSGANQVNAALATPITYSIQQQCCGLTNGPDGFLPVGSFQVCYSVTFVNGDNSQALSEACQPILVESLVPVQLQLPEDKSKINNKTPLFTWLPPAPIELIQGLNFEWTLSEIKAGQTPQMAMMQNPILGRQTGLVTTTFQFPPSAQALDTSKTYAWQITAKSAGEPYSRSEIWSFQVGEENSGNDLSSNKGVHYARVKRVQDISFVLCKGLLGLAYSNETADSLVRYSIRDITNAHQPSSGVIEGELVVALGENHKIIDLTQRQLQKDHFYLFELVNSRNERWFIKFQFKTN